MSSSEEMSSARTPASRRSRPCHGRVRERPGDVVAQLAQTQRVELLARQRLGPRVPVRSVHRHERRPLDLPVGNLYDISPGCHVEFCCGWKHRDPRFRMSRVVVVTGGAKGIGRATVAAFAALRRPGRRARARRGGAATRWASRSASRAGPSRRARCDVSDEDAGRRGVRRHRRRRRARQQRRRRRRAPRSTRTTLESWTAPLRGQRHRRLPLHPRGARRHARARRGRDRHRRLDRGPRRRALHRRLHGVQARRGRPHARGRRRGRGYAGPRQRGLPHLRRHRDDAALGRRHRRAPPAATRPRAQAALDVGIAARPAARPARGRRRRRSGWRRPRRPRSTARPSSSTEEASRRESVPRIGRVHRELGALPTSRSPTAWRR